MKTRMCFLNPGTFSIKDGMSPSVHVCHRPRSAQKEREKLQKKNHTHAHQHTFTRRDRRHRLVFSRVEGLSSTNPARERAFSLFFRGGWCVAFDQSKNNPSAHQQTHAHGTSANEKKKKKMEEKNATGRQRKIGRVANAGAYVVERRKSLEPACVPVPCICLPTL